MEKKYLLGELVNIDSGFAFKSSLFTDDNQYIPIIRIRDVNSGEASTYYSGEYDEKYIVNKGDLLISMDGSFVVKKWNSKKALLNQRVCRIKSISDNITDEYLYRILPRELKAIEDKTPFVTVKHLSVKSIENIEIKLPSLGKQKKITDILDKAQSLIDKKKEQIELLDELVKSRFVEMFGDINKNNKIWDVKILSELIDVIGGYAFKSTEFVEEGIPVLKIGNINAGYFKNTNLMFWNEEEKLERYLIRPGDLVISLTGTVGKDDYGNVCIMGKDYDKYYLNQRNAKLDIRDENILSKLYLTYALKVPEIKKRLTGISRGVRQANISNKDIQNLELPIPPIELQNKFAEFVTKTDSIRSKMEESLSELEDNFNSLMQRSFKGELF